MIYNLIPDIQRIQTLLFHNFPLYRPRNNKNSGTTKPGRYRFTVSLY